MLVFEEDEENPSDRTLSPFRMTSISDERLGSTFIVHLEVICQKCTAEIKWSKKQSRRSR